MSEKVGGAEGTKLDEEFQDLERVKCQHRFRASRCFFLLAHAFLWLSIQKADTTGKALADLLIKSSDYLQPNPAVRAKLTMANTVSKIRGQEQASGYPHPEGLLGDSMIKYGHDLGGASSLGETVPV